MALHAFTIGNYRSFVDPVRLELRPVTLLFGYNNAGKSALARVLPLLRDSVASRSSTPLNLASPAVRGGAFADLRSRSTGVRTLELGLEWDGEPAVRLELSLQDLPDRRQHMVRDFKIFRSGRVWLRGQWTGLEEGQPFDSVYQYHVDEEGRSGEGHFTWEGLVPYAVEGPDLLWLRDILLKDLLPIEWIGATRRTPDRIRLIPDTPGVALGADGAGAADLLAWDTDTGGTLLEWVSRQYQSYANEPLVMRRAGQVYSLVVGRDEVNLVDAGEGLAQVLPVLVAAAVARRRARPQHASYLVLEQPELHLHPGFLLERLRGEPKEPVAQAFQRLQNPRQRHHYNMCAGFVGAKWNPQVRPRGPQA